MTNLIVIQGRLCKPPELRNTQSGIPVASFTLANDTGAGEHKQTLFADCVAWRGLAETIAKYCEKGQMINVSGKLCCREWTDKEGTKRKSYEIKVDDFSFCGDKKKESDGSNSFQSPVAGSDFAELEDDDGDLPF